MTTVEAAMGTSLRHAVVAGCCGLAATLGAIPEVRAQNVGRIIPTNEVVLTGYGTVGWVGRTAGDDANAFTASLSPVFLWQFQDRVLFEAELEFALQEGVTETGLEYAQLDFIAADNVAFVAGKFLLPFGIFGPELHPTWINKFPTAPPLYGHHVSEFGADPLLPILSDVGVAGQVAFRTGRSRFGFNAYAANGPATEDAAAPLPELELPASSSDNNTDKAFGGRVDFQLPPHFRVNVSGYNGDYDDQNTLDFTTWNVAMVFQAKGVEVRGEYIQTRQEVARFTGVTPWTRQGFWAQATYRIKNWEPVLRWTQIFESDIEGAVQEQGAWQAGIGLDYWFSPSIAVMGGLEINREKGPEIENDRVIVHVAFGF
jgi:hypothetical protein